MKWILLGIGSVAGGFGRYAMLGVVQKFSGPQFPYGTLAVNSLGCFVVGLLHALSEQKFLLGPEARLFLMTGFCAAFTTFSTLILETMNLARNHEWTLALGNIFGSLGLGIVFFLLGSWLVKLI